MRKLAKQLGISLLILALLSGCGTTQSTTAPIASTPVASAPDGTLESITIMGTVETTSFDVADWLQTSGTNDGTIWHNVFDSLTTYNIDGQIAPRLAETWTLSDDGMSYTFNLRQDVKFHDGTPFTSADVKYSYDLALDPNIPAGNNRFIAACNVIDEYTVELVKAMPYTSLEALTCSIKVVPQSRADDVAAFALNPVGTGPYKVESLANDGVVTLVANDAYYRGAPKVRKIILVPPVDPTTAAIALETGEIDVALNLPLTQALELQKISNVTSLIESAYGAMLVVMGGNLAADYKLKQAVMHAIDREKIIQLGNEGVGVPSTDLFGSNIGGQTVGAVNFNVYDPAEAKALAAQASTDLSKPLVMTITADMAVVAQCVQEDLKAIGITLEIEQLDPNSYRQKFMSGQCQMSLFTYAASAGFAVEDALFSISPSMPGYGTFLSLSEQYEQLVFMAMMETDDAKRVEIDRQALQLAFDEAPGVPLFDLSFTLVYNKRIAGFKPINATYLMIDAFELSAAP